MVKGEVNFPTEKRLQQKKNITKYKIMVEAIIMICFCKGIRRQEESLTYKNIIFIISPRAKAHMKRIGMA